MIGGSRLRRLRAALRRPAPPADSTPAIVDPAGRVARARALLQDGRHGAVRAMAARLRRTPQAHGLGDVIAAIAAYDRGFPALAHAELAGVPPATAAALAPAEWVRSGLAVAPAETRAALRALAAEDPPGIGPRGWYELLAAVFGAGDQELARAAFARFDEHTGRDPGAWPDAARHRDSLRDWVAADAGSPSAPAPPGGRRTLAIMDYGHPGADRASANLGDHVQSIAALGHLVRHRGVRLHGRDELVAVLGRLGDRVRPERARRDVAGDVEVMTVHRDASTYQPIPPDTWVLCFGWYMHAIFTTRFGFPLHANLRPIFVSFHCNKRDLLTPDAIAYLRRYGPVGCRDWTTVHLLQSCDVPAFFSGCLTTTIDTVFPEGPAAPAGAPPAYVDIPPEDVPEGATTYKHSDPAVRRRSFVRNVGDALALLEAYRTRHSRVVTSRLHCYLPVRSIGLDVAFRPHNRADVRFDGLMEIDDAAFAAMRDGMLARLERIHAAILGGAAEAEVYAVWRELAADDVAAAQARRARPPALPAPDPAHAAAADRAVAATVHRAGRASAAQDAVHVAVVLPTGAGAQLAALVHSLLEHASRPLHLWVLARPGTAARERLAARFPGLALSWVPLRGIRGRLLRLQLAALLPGVHRAVLLPLPSVATADVAELAGLDLGGHAFAAPRRPGTNGISGFGVLHAAGNRLGDRPAVAAELRRTAHARHRFDFDAFTTRVLVADLAALRAAPLLAVADAFGLDDREALHWLAGPDRATVPDRWAWVPTRMPASGPGLVHWADGLRGKGVPERAAYRRHLRAVTPA